LDGSFVPLMRTFCPLLIFLHGFSSSRIRFSDATSWGNPNGCRSKVFAGSGPVDVSGAADSEEVGWQAALKLPMYQRVFCFPTSDS